MDAEAEREMPVGVAADVEAERVLEDLLSLKARPSIRTGTWWPPGHALRRRGPVTRPLTPGPVRFYRPTIRRNLSVMLAASRRRLPDAA